MMNELNLKTEKDQIENLKRNFSDFVLEKEHPCLMAHTVFSMDQVVMRSYGDMASPLVARKLLEDLEHYVKNYDFGSNDFRTFLAVFPDSSDYSEIDFENKLWHILQQLHELDTEAWDEKVSKDKEDENFSFSLAGTAFYIVGMHPNASRKARQSPYPALAINLHWQFEKLREMGVYENVRDKIRERDIRLQGNINPMLDDFGVKSEARQYSGREVENSWKCPFLRKN